MDIRNARARSIGDDRVDQANGGRIIARIEQIFGTAYFQREQVQSSPVFERSGGKRNRIAVRCIKLRKQGIKGRRFNGFQRERPSQKASDLDQGSRVTPGFEHHAVSPKHHPVTPREAIGDAVCLCHWPGGGVSASGMRRGSCPGSITTSPVRAGIATGGGAPI